MHDQFHHVSLLARHGQENQSFYTKLLGLRFVKNTVNQDNNRMPHYFYGDYQGTPGSLVTFFIVPLLGNRYEEKNYLATIGLKIPQNSLSFWEQRLTENKIPFNKKEKSLHFSDPDDTHIILTEVPENPLKETLVVSNDIPAAVQIIGLASTEFHVPDSEKTLAFFETFLGWQAVGNTIILSETESFSVHQTTSDKTSRMGRGSMDHIAFSVADDEALQELHTRALAQGWEIEMYVSRGYFKSLYIREPGGNRVEFATLTPGFTLDEPLEHLGETLALPPFLEPKRTAIEANLYKDM